MAQTTTKTSTRTKALAAVGVLAAIGIVGFAAAGAYAKWARPDLQVTLTPSPNTLSLVSDAVVYTVTISNAGKLSANQAETVFILPKELEKLTVTSSTLTCGLLTGDKVSCKGDIAAGKTANFTIGAESVGDSVFRCDADAESDAAIVEADPLNKIGESDETNNTASSSKLVLSQNAHCPNIEVGSPSVDYKGLSSGLPVTNGTQVRYVVPITNRGDVDFTFPGDPIIYVSYAGAYFDFIDEESFGIMPECAYDSISGDLLCSSFAIIAPGETDYLVLNFVGDGITYGTYSSTFSAEVDTNGYNDSDLSNNSNGVSVALERL